MLGINDNGLINSYHFTMPHRINNLELTSVLEKSMSTF